MAQPPKLFMRNVINTCGRVFGVCPKNIIARRGPSYTQWTRHIAIWLCYHYCARSTPKIGQFFDERDHATIINSLRRVDNRMSRCPEFAALINKMIAQIKCDDEGKIKGRAIFEADLRALGGPQYRA